MIIYKNVTKVENSANGSLSMTQNGMKTFEAVNNKMAKSDRMLNLTHRLTKSTMISIVELAMMNISDASIKRGFELTGIAPFDRDYYKNWTDQERVQKYRMATKYASARIRDANTNRDNMVLVKNISLTTDISFKQQVKRVKAVLRIPDVVEPSVASNSSNAKSTVYYTNNSSIRTPRQLQEEITKLTTKIQVDFIDAILEKYTIQQQLAALATGCKDAQATVKKEEAKSAGLDKKLILYKNRIITTNNALQQCKLDDKAEQLNKAKLQQLKTTQKETMEEIKKSKQALKQAKVAHKQKLQQQSKKEKQLVQITAKTDNFASTNTYELNTLLSEDLLSPDTQFDKLQPLAEEDKIIIAKMIQTSLEQPTSRPQKRRKLNV